MRFSVLMASIALMMAILPGYAQMNMMQANGISVTGTATVQATPDVAYVTLGAQTTANQSAKAASDNAAVMQKIQKVVKQQGIADSDVKTVQYSVEPIYDYSSGKQVFKGYQATNLIRITVKDLSKVGKLLDGCTEAGANLVQGVTFSVLNEDALRAQALELAAKNATSKATAIAKGLNVKLGEPINVTESGAPVIRPLMMTKAAAPETPVNPGQIEVDASVTVLYAINK